MHRFSKSLINKIDFSLLKLDWNSKKIEIFFSQLYQALQEKILKLEELCSKKEKFLQSTRMILKFRTEHISKLERTIKKNGLIEEDAKDKEIVCTTNFLLTCCFFLIYYGCLK